MIKKAPITISKRPSFKRLMLIVLSTVVVALAFGLVCLVGASVNEQLKGNTASNIRNTARIERLQFCVDFRISPCNDETLREWNKDHTESWQQYSH